MKRMQLGVSFKNTPREINLYDWLCKKSSPTAYLKDLAYREMFAESEGIVVRALGVEKVKEVKEEVEPKPVPTSRSKTGFKRPAFEIEDLPN